MSYFDPPRTGRAAASIALCILCLVSAACRPPAPVADTSEQVSDASGPVDDASLKERLDQSLQFTFTERALSADEQAAWQILHGVLAYGRAFQVQQDGRPVSAVELALRGGPLRGWDVELVRDSKNKRVGLRALTAPGTKAGQGHPDQWFAVLAQAGVKRDETFLVGGTRATMDDFLWQVLQDVPRNTDREYSWTLIGLTTYLPTDYQWTASDGKSWSIERLVEIELDQSLAESACGGTHRLIGMAMALDRRRAEGKPVEGVWKQAEQRIRWAVERAREFQNPDGSFSTNYFERPASRPDLAEHLGATGHTLEFLAVSLPKEELEAPWIARAAERLARLFEETRDIPLECGALYHAAHGLVLYREKRFGPVEFDPVQPVSTSPATP